MLKGILGLTFAALLIVFAPGCGGGAPAESDGAKDSADAAQMSEEEEATEKAIPNSGEN